MNKKYIGIIATITVIAVLSIVGFNYLNQKLEEKPKVKVTTEVQDSQPSSEPTSVLKEQEATSTSDELANKAEDASNSKAVDKTTSGSQQQTPASKSSSGSQQGSTQGSQQTPQPESQATTDLNAKYYTVTFIAEKGNILVNGKVYEGRYSVKVKEGTSIPNVEFPQGTRTNFGGCEWYDQKSDVSGTQFKKGTKVYSDLTVYARWQNFNAYGQASSLAGTQYTNPVRLSNAQVNPYPCRYDIYKGAIAGVTSLNNHRELVYQTKVLQKGEEDYFTGEPGKYLVVYYAQVDGELYRVQDTVITINE